MTTPSLSPPAIRPRVATTHRPASLRLEQRPVLDIAVPVHNEAADLERSVRRLDAYLSTDFPLPARITIVDNGSVDGTWAIAQRLHDELARVETIHLDEKGRGRALRAAWMSSDAAVVAYMDVDLSTDLRALPPLVAPLLSGHSDIAIGSRLLPGANVVRGARRELISRCYNRLLRTALRVRFSDAQCGFKAMRKEVAERLLPRVHDQAWFFDTELLVLGERAGLRIHEVEVDWVDDADSRVAILPTALADLRGVLRLARSLIRGRVLDGLDDLRRGRRPAASLARQTRSFVGVGVLSTLAYLALYSALRVSMTAAVANTIAMLCTAVVNTAANRRLTFGVRGRRRRLHDHIAGLLAFGMQLTLTSSALAALAAADATPSRAAEIAALLTTNAVATVARFALLRSAVMPRDTGDIGDTVPGAIAGAGLDRLAHVA